MNSEENENPDNYDTKGSVGLTSKDVDPNRGEKTALAMKDESKVEELELYNVCIASLKHV